MYFGYVSILVCSMITIPLMSGAISAKLISNRVTNIRRSTSQEPNPKPVTVRDKRKVKATIMTLVFTFFYIMFYSFTAVYYTLPLLGLCQEQLGGASFSLLHSNLWLAKGDLMGEYYFHWWLYYSAFTCSTVNCVVHFVCNSVVRDHVSGVQGRAREWWKNWRS